MALSAPGRGGTIDEWREANSATPTGQPGRAAVTRPDVGEPADPVNRDAELNVARSLFFQYDGSSFHMDRAGVWAHFRSFEVPAAVQAEWKRELLAKHLDALGRAGNRRTVHFLLDHNYLEHLPQLVSAAPAGSLWECCAYLELLLLYLDRCAAAGNSEATSNEPPAYTDAELRTALRKVISDAEALRGRPRSANSRARVQTIISNAQARLAVLDDPRAPTRWHWNPLSGTAS
jgi:hypothetical protein